MEINSYQLIKDFIYKKLLNCDGVLPQNKIQDEIHNTQDLVSKLGAEIFAQILSVSSITIPNTEDWKRMKRELETHFNVEMDGGVIVQGEEQQMRDNSWWTSKEKLKNENYYWNRYKESLINSLPPDVVKTLDEDTDIVMDNIEDPSIDNFSRYGMVVGHVQSGKTGNYSALVCKAADAGYKFIVVIAGGINNLRNQTQERMNEAFVGVDKGKPVGVGKLGDNRKELLPISLTTTEQDFNKQDANKNAQGLNFDNISSPIILVIKKNSSTLQNVISWLEAQYKNQISKHAMLMIDDESDYASINTKKEDDPTIINKRLRKLLSLFRKSVYVAYTATPYANIFIDHEAGTDDLGRDLFPKDFIYALKAPTNYFGARKIFLDTNKKHLIPIEDYSKIIPLNHKRESPITSLPESLCEAIRLFILNIGIRNLRGQGNKHNSMLIHVTRFTLMHQNISNQVEIYFSKVKKDITAFSNLINSEDHSKHIENMKQTFDKIHMEIEFTWGQVIKSISEIIKTIIIREVHTDTKIPLEYRKDRVTNAIVIGGTSLSRGFTLEGLNVSYFLRNTVFYDTLMQMGRWFGYRPDFEDLCRIYMTKEMITNFGLIIEATEDLFDNFDRMARAKMTPNDFGLSVKHHPDSGLQVTARNKLKSSKDIYFEMKLDGHLKETSWIDSDQSVRLSNLEIIKQTIHKLKPNKIEEVNKNYLWKDVNRSTVLEFLEKFNVYSPDPFGIKSRMPIDFIIKYVQEVDTYWDIALYSGESKRGIQIGDLTVYPEQRKAVNKGHYFEILNRQVSSGSSEAIGLQSDLRKELGSNRKSIREQLKKPLLMLHVLEVENQNRESIDQELAAFGISFPGGVSRTNKTVKLKINSVYIQNFLDEEDSDD
ncbi:Z1 domain-containing protein [Paenibacillus anseongense]|uniref:Z1 domain-containing protein n=1 Tax=Paenibacillus anseongense TaxID=2682845 RepID=UPI002DBDC97B|nr:Z1 domain-containing protein [Paenibacillus anseongense]MEC0269712.1 Z1 domain-containing protein [Paenibacillus anseongense]